MLDSKGCNQEPTDAISSFQKVEKTQMLRRAEAESSLTAEGTAPGDGWSQPVNLLERFGAGLQSRSVGSLKEVLQASGGK